jgi:D-aminoacyl-tRNA deacylase
MRCVVQRVAHASVTINAGEKRTIGRGLAVLLGVTHADTVTDAAYLAEKCLGLRIFPDTSGKMNLGLQELENPAGECLIVSQFTLYGDARKGRRPSFIDAARPEVAIPLYESFVKAIRDAGIHVETGEFGADMQVELINDGPVTILLDSSKQF